MKDLNSIIESGLSGAHKALDDVYEVYRADIVRTHLNKARDEIVSNIAAYYTSQPTIDKFVMAGIGCAGLLIGVAIGAVL